MGFLHSLGPEYQYSTSLGSSLHLRRTALPKLLTTTIYRVSVTGLQQQRSDLRLSTGNITRCWFVLG
jgi:hypothetical protein